MGLGVDAGARVVVGAVVGGIVVAVGSAPFVEKFFFVGGAIRPAPTGFFSLTAGDVCLALDVPLGSTRPCGPTTPTSLIAHFAAGQPLSARGLPPWLAVVFVGDAARGSTRDASNLAEK